MVHLVATTDKLQLVTGTAADVDVHASFADYNGTTVTPGKQNTAITTAATTDILAAPGASTQRKLKALFVRNKDTADSTAVTVVFDANGTDFELFAATLAPGEALVYIEGGGFTAIDSTGRARVAATPNSNIYLKQLAGDFANSNVTPLEVSGLTLALPIGTYTFEYFIRYQAALSTTGVRFDVNHTGTVSFFLWNQFWVGNLNTTSSDTADQDMIAALGGVVSAFASRAKGTAGRGTTLGTDTNALDCLMRIEGSFTATVAGNLALYSASELAAASTIKAGTFLRVCKAD